MQLDKKTKVGLRLKSEFEENVNFYRRNHLINLEPHSMPVFLYKNILLNLKKELRFKPKISNLAGKFLSSLDQGERQVVFVGLHARRGDRILNWKHGKVSDGGGDGRIQLIMNRL